MRRFLGGNWVTLLEPRRMEIWQGVLRDGEDKREGCEGAKGLWREEDEAELYAGVASEGGEAVSGREAAVGVDLPGGWGS
jgi:hypothetical protein